MNSQFNLRQQEKIDNDSQSQKVMKVEPPFYKGDKENIPNRTSINGQNQIGFQAQNGVQRTSIQPQVQQTYTTQGNYNPQQVNYQQQSSQGNYSQQTQPAHGASFQRQETNGTQHRKTSRASSQFQQEENVIKPPEKPVIGSGVTSQLGQQTYNKSETQTHLYKLVLVGDAGVGKTHIINRYVKGQLPHTIIPTIGIEFATKAVILRDGGTIKTQIWDTAGQEKYRSIISAHYRKAVGALLVYDVTKEKSFESIQRWLEEIKLHADRDIVLMLVGNKVDIAQSYPQQRRVSKEEAALFAKDNGLLFEESSALQDVNISDAFQTLLEEIYDRKCRLSSERSVVQTETDDAKKARVIFDLNLPQSESQKSSICSCN